MWWYHSTKTAKIFWVTLDVAMHGAWVTQKIFAVLVEWYHHIVLTMSFKLVDFLHLFEIKSSITRLVYEISPRSLRPTWGFLGRAIESCHTNSTTTVPGCHGIEIWDKMGYNSSWEISPRCLRLVRVFHDRWRQSLSATKPTIDPCATATKFETKYAITHWNIKSRCIMM